MDNIGDWLYIVLLVIAGVSSLFGSGKKKKRSPEVLGQPDRDIVTETESRPEGSLWDLFDEKPAPQPKPRKKKSASVNQRSKPKRETVHSSAASPFLAGESRIGERPFAHSSGRLQSLDDESDILPETTFSDMSELRKAIICAEILNRKY